MKKIKIKVDEYEYGLIVNALNELRTKQIKEGKSVDFINELMEKLFKLN